MRRIVVYALVVTMALAGGSAALAIGITASPSSKTTPAVTLNGDDQSTSWNESVSVGGANTNGWRITAYAALPASGSNQLGPLTVSTEPAAGKCTGGGCTQPVPTGITWPVTLGTSSGSATTIYNADVNTGRGSVTLTVPFQVDVLANALPGTYTTRITLTITNAGP